MYYCNSKLFTIKSQIINIISIALVAAVLLPFAVQFSHAFDEHNYSICHAENRLHIDKHEINCTVLHYKINYNTIIFSSNFLISKNQILDESIFTSESQISSLKIRFGLSRAPPIFML